MPDPTPPVAGHYLNAQPAIRLAFWACALIVLVLSLLPGDKLPMPSTGWDKADHLLAYTVMAALGCLGWPKRILLVLAALLAFGIVIEGLQEMTGYRTGDFQDVVAEVIGLALGSALAWGVGGVLGWGRRGTEDRRGDVALAAASAAVDRRVGGGDRR